MSRRIVLTVVAVIAAALVAFAVPLAVAVQDLLETRALDELQSEVETLGLLLETEATDCTHLQGLVAALGRSDQTPALSLFTLRGADLFFTVAERPPTVGVELQQAREQLRTGRRHGGGHLAVAVPLSTGECGRALVLHAERPDTVLAATVRRTWLALALVGAAVLAFAAALGRYVAERLARPLHELAGSAAALGEGDFSVRVPRSGLPEIDAIATTLDRTAERLGRAVDRGRTFAADASHQLRTPLTALRLHLEGLEASGVAPEQVAAALTETDRLEATVAELVALTSLDTAEERISPAALVQPPVDAARTAARGVGRDVVVETLPSPDLRVRPAAIRQALQVLLDNALQHGQGTITVRVGPTLPDESVPGRAAHQGLRLCVWDEGPGPSPEVLEALRARDRGLALPVSGGRGLALARTLVEGEGGRLTHDDADGRTRVCLVLPAHETAGFEPRSSPPFTDP